MTRPHLTSLPTLVFTLLVVGACRLDPPSSRTAADHAEPVLDVVALTAPELKAMLASGDVSAVAVTQAYLERIAAIDDAGPELNAIIEINPEAISIARSLDGQFATNGPVGPLHGLPVVLKANIDTGDAMATSAGSLALADHHAAEDAFHVARLREAGAVILAKTNLSEWANFRDEKSSSGWSSLGGQTKNPHVLDRNPCGSSSGSGVAVAASLAPLAVGTETNGSVVCPAGANGIVGIKPTLGIVSRGGIIPIAHSQDTAGPMAKTVTGAAMLLEAMVAFDDADGLAVAFPDGGAALVPDPAGTRLDGKRIGIFRSYDGAGEFPRVEAVFDNAVKVLQSLGATIVDPIEYQRDDASAAQYDVLLYEFKADLNAYLASHHLPDDVDTLADLIVYNDTHAERVMPVFGQSIFHDAQAKGDLATPEYLQALVTNNDTMRADVTALLDDSQLDALFIPVNGPAWKTDWVEGDRYSFGGTASLGAISGFPNVVLPAGDVSGLPIAVGFVGRALTEPELIQMAYAFEQATHARIEPTFIPTLER